MFVSSQKLLSISESLRTTAWHYSQTGRDVHDRSHEVLNGKIAPK